MKTSKYLFLLFVIPLLVSCYGQKTQTPEPTIIASAPTTPFLDFDHPRLHEIAGNKPLVINEISRFSMENISYVGVIVETGDVMLKNEMLIFRVKDNVSTLIYDLPPDVFMSFNIAYEDHPAWLIDQTPPVGFVVFIGNGGNCYDCGRVIQINITEDGEAKDVTPKVNFLPKGFVYIMGSERAGRLALVGTQYYEFDYGACDHVSSPFAFRLFEWNGSAYMDVSKDEKEFYDQKIAELITVLQTNWNGTLHACWVMPTLANIFFAYESSGRVEYGWEQIKSLGDLSHWDIPNTPPEDIQKYHDVFSQLEQRKNEDLATVTP